MRKKMGIAVIALGALALGGCGDGVHGIVVDKMHVPAYYKNDGTHVPACWEIIVQGTDGGSYCTSMADYMKTVVGSKV
jgi:hypothetical protein